MAYKKRSYNYIKMLIGKEKQTHYNNLTLIRNRISKRSESYTTKNEKQFIF